MSSPLQRMGPFLLLTLTLLFPSSTLPFLLLPNSNLHDSFFLKSTTNNPSTPPASSAPSDVEPAPNQVYDDFVEDDDVNRNEPKTWKDSVDEILDPKTDMNDKRALLQSVLSDPSSIATSFQSALSSRSLSPLLTPRAKSVVDSVNANTRQLADDILPSLASAAASSSPASTIQTAASILQSELTSDVASPELLAAKLSFLNPLQSSPSLSGPPYTVKATRPGYTLRSYPPYSVYACPLPGPSPFSLPDAPSQTAAVQSLVSSAVDSDAHGRLDGLVMFTSFNECRVRVLPPPSDDDDEEEEEAPERCRNADGDKPASSSSSAGVVGDGGVKVVSVLGHLSATSVHTSIPTQSSVSLAVSSLLSSLEADGVELEETGHGEVVDWVVGVR
eukprot:CAMPEP_0182455124 /NCGR_PEP_ID=MMETSP1319-20130603/1436_1 /TAXON_ID=172717 /ORGANISM="Bolidomonas pacifica, Strain RCC208" /LENGTH=388 /DNA_ID=CAMNT_0024653159 /DNA_START=173 /DNA_END=1336 /DNA_ORIENTATION=+